MKNKDIMSNLILTFAVKKIEEVCVANFGFFFLVSNKYDSGITFPENDAIVSCDQI